MKKIPEVLNMIGLVFGIILLGWSGYAYFVNDIEPGRFMSLIIIVLFVNSVRKSN